MQLLPDAHFRFIKAKRLRQHFLVASTICGAITVIAMASFLGSIIKSKNSNTLDPLTPPSTANLEFACTYGYSYLSVEDAFNFKQKICESIDSSKTYRIQGGGSVRCQGEILTVLRSDPQVLSEAICVKMIPTTLIDKFVIAPPTAARCPEGYARATVEETLNLVNQQSCFIVYFYIVENINMVLRIEAQGTVESNDFYSCTFSQWSNANIDYILCIQRDLQDMVIKPINETQCGTGKSLYTLEEALRDRIGQNVICPKIPTKGVLRLSGGAVMYGSGQDCKIIESNNTNIGKFLCQVTPRPTSSANSVEIIDN